MQQARPLFVVADAARLHITFFSEKSKLLKMLAVLQAS
jgi:hypothetical protein